MQDSYDTGMKRFNQRGKFNRRPAASPTSWEGVADWYGKHLNEGNALLNTVVYPAAMKSLGELKGKSFLDIACGEGAFSRLAAKAGAVITAFDAAPSLVEKAKRQAPTGSRYFVADAQEFFLKLEGAKFDAAACLLAIQNIREPRRVFRDVASCLKPGGTFTMVMNHPCFRIPRQSSWGFEDQRKIQYRRIDMYLSDLNVPITAHPGEQRSEKTVSHHRPLSHYVNEMGLRGLAVVGMEELVSDRVSDSGPRAKAENRARHEIPMFLLIKAQKI